MTSDIGDEPSLIAVCGIGVRLPGGVQSPDDFWDLLVNGKDARKEIPLSRYNIHGFDDSLDGKGVIKAKHGYFLDNDLSRIDASCFSMTKQELEHCDPQQRQLLEVVKETLDDAGEANYRGQPIGCYVGTFCEDWSQIGNKETQHPPGNGYIATGNGDLMIANRVSYEYDLHGPSIVVKTGCSASFVALHEARRALQCGDASAAIVAGTNIIITPTMTATFTSQGLLSPDGRCKAFDERANGFARAEAITCVYLKTLPAALRDGNPIRAILRASGLGSDGKTNGLLHPSGAAHERLMRHVYAQAGLNPAETAFVECHGTGTQKGDMTETHAVARVFGDRGVHITSVKANVGHSEGSSGMTSFIKAVLALQHDTIPPQINFQTPNPKIPFESAKLKVPLKPEPFPYDRKQRVSINSFGIGGANAHAIVEAYLKPQSTTREPRRHHPELLLLSASSATSIKGQVERHQEFAKASDTVDLTDLAYTLAVRRVHMPYRAFTVWDGTDFVETAGHTKIPGVPPSLTLIFTGQGAQWPEMAKDLIMTNKFFKDDLCRLDSVLQRVAHAPSWSITEELLKPAETSKIGIAELSQPLTTAVQIGIFNILKRSGIKPSSVIGHSSGEIAAAYACGSLSMEAAIIISYYRGFVTKYQFRNGAMAAVELSSQTVRQYLHGKLEVACENSPNSITVSGDRSDILEFIDKVKTDLPDTMVRLLKVNMAYHSYHMEELGDQYEDLLRTDLVKLDSWHNSADTALISTVTGSAMPSDTIYGPEYWRANLVQPVRFSTAVGLALASKPDSVFLEIGPHSTLAGPIRQICLVVQAPFKYSPTLVRGGNSSVNLLSAIGRLYQEAVPLDFTNFYPDARVLQGLPTYAWDHEKSYWGESRVSRDWRQRQFSQHPLLGARVPEAPNSEPQWRNMLYLEEEPWLADHRMGSDIIFPFAAYIAMATEAIRQIKSGEKTGYRLRHTVARSALVVNETRGHELVTTLRRQHLSDQEESEWFEFTVSSYEGSSWQKHCSGQIKAIPIEPPKQSSRHLVQFPRKVDHTRYYDYAADIGMNYGTEFRVMRNITSSATTSEAAAEILAQSTASSKAYALHPITIDAIIHLVILAKAQGLGRKIGGLCVPTVIESLDVFPFTGELLSRAWFSSGSTLGNAEGFSKDSTPVVRLSGVEFAPYSLKTSSNADRHAAARLEWFPHADFVDHAPLCKPAPSSRDDIQIAEEITFLSIIETFEKLRGLDAGRPHLSHWKQWIEGEITRAMTGEYHPLVPDARNYLDLPTNERTKLIEIKCRALGSTTRAIVGEIAKGVCDNAEEIFTGAADAIDILMQDSLLTRLYSAMTFDYGASVRLLAVARPTLRILEVGAGTGGTTEPILHALIPEHGFPCYSKYTFTDVSVGFFQNAKERFSQAPNMEYKVLDITTDPTLQGFSASSYDVIIAANVVHATPSLQTTLRNLNELLVPGGTLIMTEICTSLRSPTYVFGTFSGWWLGSEDARGSEPYVDPERWHDELLASGFTGVDTLVRDQEEPYTCMATFLSRRVEEVKPLDGGLSLLALDHQSAIALSLRNSMETANFRVAQVAFGNPLPKNQDVLCCIDLEANFFHDLDAGRLSTLQALLKDLSPHQHVFWLTKPTQVKCASPRTALTIGLTRTIRTEYALPFCTLEIDPSEDKFSSLVLQVLNKIRKDEDQNALAAEKEYVVTNGQICVGRYSPLSLERELAQRSIAGSDKFKALDIGRPGLISTLAWTERAVTKSAGVDEVAIRPVAAGLNLRDVLVAMGLIPQARGTSELGLEVAGIITACGSNVEDLEVGDRVFALTSGDGLSSQAVTHCKLVGKIPDPMSFEQAASVPTVFVTAIMCLLRLGHLEKGQAALIQSACGGVGMAAIQVCKMVGAEIYATVGSKEKEDYLVKQFGIPRRRIFSSRDASFYDSLMAETDGRGVDLVLNSLSGELLHTSWKCVAEFGVLVEIGKRDLLGHGRLDMNPFLANRRYVCYDGFEYAKKRPDLIKNALEGFLEGYTRGELFPIPRITVFPASDIEQAFRHLQNGSHIGKVVVAMEDLELQPTSLKPSYKPMSFDPQASYLLTGGFGGLGKATAVWLVQHGARSLTFLSRGARSRSPETQDFIKELESMGCDVVTVAGRCESVEDVRNAVALSKSPIKGVFHLAMVLRDGLFSDMGWSDWEQVVAPKVQGAWNLHNELLQQPLDFFWLASTIVSLVDQTGQGNYSAASTFLEALCQYRHGMGLPASVLNICAMEGLGFVAENAAARRSLKTQGITFAREREYLDFVELTLHAGKVSSVSENPETPSAQPWQPWRSDGQVIMGLRSELHLDDPQNRVPWRRDRRMGFYHNSELQSIEVGSNTSKSLKKLIHRIVHGEGDETETLLELAGEFGNKVMDLMMRQGEEADTSLSAVALGLDSLIATELRRWLRGVVGLTITVAEIMDAKSLRSLAEMAAGRLKAKHRKE